TTSNAMSIPRSRAPSQRSTACSRIPRTIPKGGTGIGRLGLYASASHPRGNSLPGDAKMSTHVRSPWFFARGKWCQPPFSPFSRNRGLRALVLGRRLLVDEPVDAAVVRSAALARNGPAYGVRHRAMRLPALLGGIVQAAATHGRQHVGGPMHSTHSLRSRGRAVLTESR